MEKPALTKVSQEVRLYIDYLETRLSIIDNNADVEVYVALNKQLSEIARQISEATLDIADKEDIAYERFVDFTLKSKMVSENMNYFRSKLTPDQIKKRTDASAEEHIFNEC